MPASSPAGPVALNHRSQAPVRRGGASGSLLAHSSRCSVASPPVDPEQQRVERVLEQGLERVQTPEAARAVINRVERLSRGKTEEQSGQVAVLPAAASETD